MGRFASAGVTHAAAIAGTILVLSLNALLVLQTSASRFRVCPAPLDSRHRLAPRRMSS
jgi:ABC-type sulfate transport system permease component